MARHYPDPFVPRHLERGPHRCGPASRLRAAIAHRARGCRGLPALVDRQRLKSRRDLPAGAAGNATRAAANIMIGRDRASLSPRSSVRMWASWPSQEGARSQLGGRRPTRCSVSRFTASCRRCGPHLTGEGVIVIATTFDVSAIRAGARRIARGAATTASESPRSTCDPPGSTWAGGRWRRRHAGAGLLRQGRHRAHGHRCEHRPRAIISAAGSGLTASARSGRWAPSPRPSASIYVEAALQFTPRAHHMRGESRTLRRLWRAAGRRRAESGELQEFRGN